MVHRMKRTQVAIGRNVLLAVPQTQQLHILLPHKKTVTIIGASVAHAVIPQQNLTIPLLPIMTAVSTGKNALSVPINQH
jgi:hypothetical protein